MKDITLPAAPTGRDDLAAAARALAERLPVELAPLAEIAYNYVWAWMPDGPDLFRSIDPGRWDMCGENPVRLLEETPRERLTRVAADPTTLDRAARLRDRVRAYCARPERGGRASRERPIAFLCAEFAIHKSLPIYSGGLGVLAGDILKEASDLSLPMVGVGLLYRQGYFLQRVDQSGYQHEYWVPLDAERTPLALVRDDSGAPVTVSVPVRGHDVVVQIWRVDVGTVPLYLLDADRSENSRYDRWITGRLYVSDRATRLAQYALLGVGSMRALAAMGMDPSVVHLNEGHAALAPLELARRQIAEGTGRHDAFTAARQRTVFTTHTPVSAGNEGYDLGEIADVLGGFPTQVGLERDTFLELGRTRADNPHEPFVMTPLGIKMSHFANGVSKRHGEVARGMWRPLFPERPTDAVPIGHVTNGVHVPTWMAPPMRALLDRHLGADWVERAAHPATWEPVDRIPDAELWDVRCAMRSSLIDFARDQTVANRLIRNESRDYVEAGERGFRTDVLTIGFARRLATYKRLYILTMEQHRIAQLLENEQFPVQLLVAGKAHPQDEEGKRSPQGLFSLKHVERAAERISFIDNYDLSVAAHLVAGCDLWVNLPRPPLEASGTSGMKSALNGGLNLSIMDGWWEEAYDGSNGWSITGDTSAVDAGVQDARDAAAFYDLLEHEVAPLFYERDERGIPTRWLQKVRASLRTNGPRFSATRMVEDYVEHAYTLGVPRR